MPGILQTLLGSYKPSAYGGPTGNLITNPDFETVTIDTGFLFNGGRTTAQAQTGSYSLVAGADELGNTLNYFANVLAVGFPFSLSFWIKGTSAFTLNNGIYFGNTNASTTINVTTSWQQITILNKTVTNNIGMTINLYTLDFAQNFWIDNIVLQYGPTA